MKQRLKRYLCNPQLKSCGSIEAGLDLFIYPSILTTIRNWKVAAPLKLDFLSLKLSKSSFNPQLKSCGSIEATGIKTKLYQWFYQSATEKLRLHWSNGYPPSNNKKALTIRNWKVAAPLKHRRHWCHQLDQDANPQLKSCGSIEALFALTIARW